MVMKIVRVRVTPGAKREYIRVGKKEVFDVSVKERAEAGRANGRMKELVAGYLKVPLKNIALVKGSSASRKTLRVFLP